MSEALLSLRRVCALLGQAALFPSASVSEALVLTAGSCSAEPGSWGVLGILDGWFGNLIGTLFLDPSCVQWKVHWPAAYSFLLT